MTTAITAALAVLQGGQDAPPDGGGGGGFPGVVEWMNETLFTISEEPISILDLVISVMIVLLAYQVSRTLQRLAHRGMRAAGIESEATTGTVSHLIHYGTVLLGFLIAIGQLGIRLETLLTAGAVFAVAFGFAMQKITENFVSGVILLLERSIKPGDVIEVEQTLVRVVEMGIRSTVVRSLDEEEMVVPNSSLVQTTVKNYTLRDSLYRLRATVGVVYTSDMELVRKTLEDMARGLDWHHRERGPRIHLLAFADSAVVWEVSVWIQNPWHKARLANRLHEAIWWALKEKNITIAYPQLDLHLDPGVEGALQRMGSSAGAGASSGPGPGPGSRRTA